MEKNLRQQKTTIIKIALFGPESTGKTTLAKQLAAYFETEWVPEFARDYLQKKWEENQHICDADDMLPIAYGQVALENQKLASSKKYLFCDTNLMVTKVFSEMYYGFCDPLLNEAALEHDYDLFFLTDIDVPWEKDDIRDSPKGRETVFSVFKQTLIDTKKPFITLSGDKEFRLAKATAIVENLTVAKEKGFSSRDFVEIYNHGISFDTILKQLEIFKDGIVKSNLISPATINNGILSLTQEDFKEKANFFDLQKSNLKLKKFVPASGAASRMFKFLSTFLNDFDIQKETINAYINRKKDSNLSIFIVAMDKFPFFKAVDKKLREIYPDFETLERDNKNYYFIKLLLSPDYFDFANKPKAVLPFHQYKNHIANPIEEHLNECIHYATADQVSNLHFTVSEIHQNQFEKEIESVKHKVEKSSGVTIKIGYSYQNKSTDSITVDAKNKMVRDKNDSLIFRPGGHGALIENLNRLNADIIFVKNIDNVIQNHIDQIALYKKALAGILIEVQREVFGYLKAIEKQEITQTDIEEIIPFLLQKLNIELTNDFNKFTFENKIIKIKELLNRPIRVCGMVKNEGEPGGGPFWVINDKGSVSLQIVETSQVDLLNAKQVGILAEATHFNPVDLVCGIKNYKNEKFDLTQFTDPKTGFIVEKSVEGKTVKSYELPGLWNGAMANWLTIFVAVPLITFNPVKTVNDLLKPAHQPQ
ncbi:ATPase [Flavobacteriaceae bacterium CRH]|nr:ATPase [Flavobacteriaceae bacterium CRH]